MQFFPELNRGKCKTYLLACERHCVRQVRTGQACRICDHRQHARSQDAVSSVSQISRIHSAGKCADNLFIANLLFYFSNSRFDEILRIPSAFHAG